MNSLIQITLASVVHESKGELEDRNMMKREFGRHEESG